MMDASKPSGPTATALYFSGTGGTRWVARRWARHWALLRGDCGLMALGYRGATTPDRESSGDPQYPGLLALFFPAHAAAAPGPVMDWAAAYRGDPSPVALYSISAAGAVWPNNDARRRLRRVLEERGARICQEAMLVMASNWALETPPALKAPLFAAVDRHCERLVRDLDPAAATKVRWAPLSMMVSWVSVPQTRHSVAFGQNLSVGASCTSCGMCVDACPVGNISLDTGSTPVFSDRCTQCMGCLYACPPEAIQPGLLAWTKHRGSRVFHPAGDPEPGLGAEEAARRWRLNPLWYGVARYLRTWSKA